MPLLLSRAPPLEPDDIVCRRRDLAQPSTVSGPPVTHFLGRQSGCFLPLGIVRRRQKDVRRAWLLREPPLRNAQRRSSNPENSRFLLHVPARGSSLARLPGR